MIENFMLYPAIGTFDVQDIRLYLNNRDDVLLDPLGSGRYFICGSSSVLPLIHEKRLNDLLIFPIVIQITNLQPDQIYFSQEYGHGNMRVSLREIVEWILNKYSCRIVIAYDFFDCTDLVKEKGLDFIFKFED